MPLPQESHFSGRISGNKPYFEGPNNAACVATTNRMASCKGKYPVRSATIPPAMAAISISLVPMITCRLLKRSARNPPVILNSTRGTEKNNKMIGTILSACARVSAMLSAMYDKRFWNALVLNAPWNCVTFSAQKLRRQVFSIGCCGGNKVAFGSAPGAGVEGEGPSMAEGAVVSGMVSEVVIWTGHSGTSSARCKCYTPEPGFTKTGFTKKCPHKKAWPQPGLVKTYAA